MNNKYTIPTLKIFLAILLVICVLPLEYQYYQFLRFTAFCLFLYFAYAEKRYKLLVPFWIISALLINPFYKIWFLKPTWNIIDIIWSIILILSLFNFKKK